MNLKAALALAMLASSVVLFSAASAADDAQLMEMRDSVVAVGGDWAVIEEFLFALPQEERDLVIDTYPERIAELEAVRRAIEESGAGWTAGLNTVSILPPELRPGTVAFSLPAEAGGVPHETVTIGPGEGGLAVMALPTSWDWRSVSGNDWTTPIKNQGNCGSCWAFAALGAIESRVKLAADNPDLVPDFSEQYLLSCSPGNCTAVKSDEIANWILCSGTVDEACFPYEELDTIPCSDSCFDRDSRKYKGEGWTWVCDNWYTVDVDRIKQEVLSGGPVSTFMKVYDDFDNYNGGIYVKASDVYLGDNFVDIVGWGNDSGVDYWICKNSWGDGWGEDGWFKIKMGEANIGAQAIAYQPKIRGKVLFYEGHVPWEDFELLKRYSEWGNRLASNGYLVHSTTTTPLTLDLLECYDVVVISNPTTSFVDSELAALKEFVGRGRVIGSGDGDLFDSNYTYLQDNERMAVEYVDWLATGEGGGLLVMGERGISNDEANQIANMFGLNFNNNMINDSTRYDSVIYWPILGPEDDVEVLASCSLDISKDAFALARATSSGYVSASLAAEDGSETAASYEAIGGDLTPEDMPPVGELSLEGELTPPPVYAEDEIEVSTSPVPLAGLAFSGPIGIAAIDLGRKGEGTIGRVVASGGMNLYYLDYNNDGVSDFYKAYGSSANIPIVGDWDGDGKDTIGRVVASGGVNVYYLDYNNDGSSDFSISYGSSVDIPIVGDWNGDGKDTIGRVIASGGVNVYYLDYNNDGASDFYKAYGSSANIPIVGDWDGDGKDTIGRVVASGGVNVYYLDYNNDGIDDVFIPYGSSLDKPIVGDWNGDGKDTIGRVVASGGVNVYYLDYNNDGTSDFHKAYGSSLDKPIVGDWYKKAT